MHVPDFSISTSTHPNLPAHCAKVAVRRKPPGSTFLWTVTLEWPLDEEWADSTIRLPSPFDRDEQDINDAVDGSGPAYQRVVHLAQECTATVSTRVSGATEIPAVDKAPAIVRKVEVLASEGSCVVRALLVVEVAREDAPKLLDVIDADVNVRTVVQEGLFDREVKAAEEEANGDDGSRHASKRRGERATA